jgi:hypothetical protein
MGEIYPSGPDLSPFFPKPPKPLTEVEIALRLPAAFDDKCTACSESMELMPVFASTRHKPFATFQCPNCLLRLFLIETPGAPLLVRSDSIESGSVMTFSECIDKKIAERDHDLEVHELRYG